MDRSVILLELNEVPYKIIDYYCEQRPDSALARNLGRCLQYETISPEEELQLHPWCTWPTLHRGVDSNSHGILRLGQNLGAINEQYDSIWSLLADAGVKTGVFGPFNSNPLPADHEKYAFYIPDVFGSEEVLLRQILLPRRNYGRQTRDLDCALCGGVVRLTWKASPQRLVRRIEGLALSDLLLQFLLRGLLAEFLFCLLLQFLFRRLVSQLL